MGPTRPRLRCSKVKAQTSSRSSARLSLSRGRRGACALGTAPRGPCGRSGAGWGGARAGRGRIQRRGHVALRLQGGKGRLRPQAAWGLVTFRRVPGRGAAPGRLVGRSSGLEAWHRVVGYQRPLDCAGGSTRPVSLAEMPVLKSFPRLHPSRLPALTITCHLPHKDVLSIK